MRHLLRAALPVKLAILLALVGAIAVLAAPPADLPDAADGGQTRAEAGQANADAAADGKPADAGSDADVASDHVEDVTATLADNQERLLENLERVWAKLVELDNEQAAAALSTVIDRLSNENIGLTRAAEAVGGAGGAADLPEAASDHPTADDHPGRP